MNGGIVTLLILAPNILTLLLPPQGKPQAEPHDKAPRPWEVLERFGQVACFALPFFYQFQHRQPFGHPVLIVTALAMALYYAGWARYLLRGRYYPLLFKLLLAIPLPMAVAPVVCFSGAAIMLRSWPLALATVIFGLGHIRISHSEYRQITDAV